MRQRGTGAHPNGMRGSEELSGAATGYPLCGYRATWTSPTRRPGRCVRTGAVPDAELWWIPSAKPAPVRRSPGLGRSRCRYSTLRAGHRWLGRRGRPGRLGTRQARKTGPDADGSRAGMASMWSWPHCAGISHDRISATASAEKKKTRPRWDRVSHDSHRSRSPVRGRAVALGRVRELVARVVVGAQFPPQVPSREAPGLAHGRPAGELRKELGPALASWPQRTSITRVTVHSRRHSRNVADGMSRWIFCVVVSGKVYTTSPWPGSRDRTRASQSSCSSPGSSTGSATTAGAHSCAWSCWCLSAPLPGPSCSGPSGCPRHMS